MLCPPGEPVKLIPEPSNPVDPHAVAVYSARGVQIGYLTAGRAPWNVSMIKNGIAVRAIFRAATPAGAAIRVGLDGENPVLPPPPIMKAERFDDDGFWPDEIPPNDWRFVPRGRMAST